MVVKSQTKLPEHVAIIMDGNGRWAKQKGLPRVAGHRAGVKTLRNLIEKAVRLELKAVTVYAFSQENWLRPEREVSLLMDLFMTALKSEVADLHKNNVRLNFIGERTAFNKKLQKSIDDSESLTGTNSGLILNVAVNYSGRWDMLHACQSIVSDPDIKQVSEALINEKLSLSSISDPDLFIRTGGEQRISNFLLWQLAYTELYFTDTLWPDFDAEQFELALNWFANRQRRFGKTSEQIEQTQTLKNNA